MPLGPPRFVFTAPRRTLFDLLMREAGLDDTAQPIPTVSREGPLPLSFAQQRLWFLDQFEPGSPLYVIPIVLQLDGPLDVSRFHAALQSLVVRHETLRTVFAQTDGQPHQVIHAELALPLPLRDLSELAPEFRAAETQRVLLEEVQRPFDLATGPLVRATLIRQAPQTHILCLLMQHIISDGWTIGVLLREVAAVYAASPALAPLPIQYADFAVWQRARLQGEQLAHELAYWKAQLAEAPTFLEFPTDKPRPAERTYWGSRIARPLPSALAARVNALAHATGVTPFTLLLTVFAILLHRYTGKPDILIGTPVANRSRRELEGLLGFFVNTLVLRATVAHGDTFRALLRRMGETVVEAQAHQETPFELLVDALQPERDLSTTPLFQVMFDLQQRPVSLTAANLTLRLLDPPQGISKFDFTLKVIEEPGGGFTTAVDYNTALFTAARMEQLLAHFQVLLESALAMPDSLVAHLSLLTPEELAVLVKGSVAPMPAPAVHTLHAAVAAQAAATPDAPAVLFGDFSITYGELEQRATQLAHDLQSRGIGPEQRVGLCARRTPEMVVALLGILKAGAAYVPLEVSDPPERLRYLLADAGITLLVVTHAELLADLSPVPPCLCLEDVLPTVSAATPLPQIHPDGAAYVIYTSGSTGQPKGVVVSHRSTLNYLTWVNQVLLPNPAERLPVVTRLAFDASLKQVFAPLLRGEPVWLLPEGVLEDPAALMQTLAAQPATAFNGVPTLWQALLDAVEQGRAAAPSGSLRRVLLGGEALSPALVERTQRWLPDTALWNVYGPTELTANAAAGPVASADAITIGPPIANARAYIVDGNGELLPAGLPGELLMGGAGVARGYLGRPALTAERFVPDPFGAEPGARLYRTGDLARLREDGQLEFLGRSDQQVKVRGFRVELGEIEYALLRHPAVREAAVIAREGRLLAYVTPESDPAALRDALAQSLPDYMLPAAFVMLPALPLTPTGKVDRRALPDPTYERLTGSAGYVAPGNAAETTLAQIWADVLRLERVGTHDNFFALGGDSILSIQVIARAAQAGLRLTPKQLFRHQTIAELAAVVETAPPVAAEQGPVIGPVPLTPIQHRFFELLPPQPHHWNQAALVIPDAPLDPRILEQAVAALLAHHDALRLRFTHEAGVWRQSNAAPSSATPFASIDLTGLPANERGAALEQHAAQAQTSLDLAHGPLLCVRLFELGETQRLLVIVHHLAVDGVSWRILMEDLRTAYAQLAGGHDIHLPPKTTAFKQWATRLAEYAQSEAARAEAAYWLRAIPKTAPLLPRDMHTPDEDQLVHTEQTVTLTLSAQETHTLLREASTAYNTRIEDLLLAALVWAFAPWLGTRALLVDLEGHGREDLFADVDLSRTVGWFTALYPVYIDLAEAQDFGAAIKATKETLRAVPHGGLGYGVLRYLGHEGAAQLQARPQAELVFNYLGQFAPVVASAPESIGPLTDPQARRRHALEISALIDPDTSVLQVTWRFSVAVHRPETVTRLAQTYLNTLREFVAHCLVPEAGGYTPSDFPEAALSQAELDDLLADFADLEGDG